MQVKKVFVWCPYVEEFVTYVAYCRGYEDQDLQIDMGMDAGKNKSILGLLLRKFIRLLIELNLIWAVFRLLSISIADKFETGSFAYINAYTTFITSP